MAKQAVAIIPARYAATRLPGKLIKRDPAGKCLIEYVGAAAQRASRIGRVIVATDDERILAIAQAAGLEARMTSPDHTCGTDRVAEVAAGLEAEVIVNCQADEPQLRPEMVDQTVALLEADPECVMSTLACEVQSEEEFADPNVVKVVVDGAGRALYFSRAPIPFWRDRGKGVRNHLCEAPGGPCGQMVPDTFSAIPLRPLHHIGLYGFRRGFLLEYARLPKTRLEETEKLEQLRALYHGYQIKVGVTPYRLIGVDTPADFEAFSRRVRGEMRGKS